MALDELKIGGMGASRRRVEDNRFIRGKGKYIDDVVLPAMLHMEVLRSPVAHARAKVPGRPIGPNGGAVMICSLVRARSSQTRARPHPGPLSSVSGRRDRASAFRPARHRVLPMHMIAFSLLRRARPPWAQAGCSGAGPRL